MINTNDSDNNEGNYTIDFITENKKQKYQVFSIYKVEKENYSSTFLRKVVINIKFPTIR